MDKTNILHKYTLNELIRTNCVENKYKLISAEKTTILCADKKGKPIREGKFDFLIETQDYKVIGIEVLGRPSRGKMKSKLDYTGCVDEFIFVLPKETLQFYKRSKGKVFHKQVRPKSFGAEFDLDNLYAWIFDVESKKFIEKDKFSNVFYVENE